jgi:hypothetical protein
LIFVSVFGYAETYQKQVSGKTLKITSPASYRRGSSVYFNSTAKRPVVLTYGKTKITAQEASIQETKNKIYLKGGFYSQYLDNEIIGSTVMYNPLNNFFEAQKVTVKTKKSISSAESFSYYGEKISLKNATFGVSLIKLDLDFEQLDLYPGWIVAHNARLRLFGYPFFYVPVIVDDKRRNAFKLPDPLPEFGRDTFRGDYWRWNNHYYINEYLYGNFQFGRSKEKGAGYGGQQIVRFSDYDQFTYINQNWQYDRPQEVFSFEHSFLELPRPNGQKKFTFNELLRYNEEVSELPANRINFTKSRFEEINESIIHRNNEIMYEGRFTLPWQELTLYTHDYSTAIEELTTAVSARKFSSTIEIERETQFPVLGPITLGIGDQSIHYDAHPYSWYRVYDYAQAKRTWWIFEADAKATDYLDEQGGSPFLFDQKNELSDNIRTGTYVNLFNMQFGRVTTYSPYDGKISDIIYKYKLKTSSWLLYVDYSLRKELWSAGLQVSIM